MGYSNNIIIEHRLDEFMGNQYSITVSDETDEVLQELRKHGFKVSQMIDTAVKTLGRDALMVLHAVHRRSDAYLDAVEEGRLQ